MKFPPTYIITPKITQLLYELDVLKAGYALHPVPRDQEISLRRASLLKSSLFSARIEGNPLELADVEELNRNDQDISKMEIANLVFAYENIPTFMTEEVTINTLKNLHAHVLKDISGNAGYLRTEESAIYNQAGVAVYLSPGPRDVPVLLTTFCKYINTMKDPAPVTAGVSHIWFEKIHPFIDGNGRVGRLLSAIVLKKGGYDFSGLVPFEEYLEAHRNDYYYFLGKDQPDVTEFVEFYLKALLDQARLSLKVAHQPRKLDVYAHLLPRRAEIMRIIEDHKIITFDFLARRFRAVPARTLHNDVFQLVKAGLVQKMGSTRGVSYSKK